MRVLSCSPGERWLSVTELLFQSRSVYENNFFTNYYGGNLSTFDMFLCFIYSNIQSEIRAFNRAVLSKKMY